MLLNKICTNFAWKCTVSALTGYETDRNIEKDKEAKDAVIQDRKNEGKKKKARKYQVSKLRRGCI